MPQEAAQGRWQAEGTVTAEPSGRAAIHPPPTHPLAAGDLHKLGRPAVLRRLPLHAHKLQALWESKRCEKQQPRGSGTQHGCRPHCLLLARKGEASVLQARHRTARPHLEVALAIINEALGQHLRSDGRGTAAVHETLFARDAQLVLVAIIGGTVLASLESRRPHPVSDSQGSAPHTCVGPCQTRGWPRHGHSPP